MAKTNLFKRIATVVTAAVAGVFGLGGCSGGDIDFGVKGTDGLGDKAVPNQFAIVYFSYSYNNSFGDGSYTYSIDVDDAGRAVLTYETFNWSDMGPMTCDLPADVLTALKQLYLDHGIAGWNGFSKYATDVCDGDGFGLSMTFADGERLTASGSNVVPQGYRDFVAAVDDLLAPYVAQAKQEALAAHAEAGLTGNLDALMVVFKQQGASGKDEYRFVITASDIRTNNIDITITSVSGDVWPVGTVRYYCALPDEAIDFGAVKDLLEKYGLVTWHHWEAADPDYSNCEWFQVDFGFDDDARIEAYGTAYPEGYAAFRADFLALMVGFIDNAVQNYGMEPYGK